MNKQHYCYSSLEPPTALHHGGVFYLQKTMEDKMKKIDETAGRLGLAMRQARRVCRLSQDDAAAILCIMPTNLAEYEFGVTKIPFDVLEHLFVMGYKMLQVRTTESRYRRHRKVFNKIKDAVAEMS